jgi:pimeloyl-ACP methyl ester carboxylesterase
MNREANFVTLADGRQLAYAEYGDPEGEPTLYCHGFPGSRIEALLFDQAAKHHKLRVIAPDRSGLGLSDAKPDRRLIDWADDIAELADSLQIDRLFLIGVSGGGPYALACAHRLTDRFSGLTLVCPLGPLDQPGLLASMRWPAQINFRSIRMTPWVSEFAFRFAVVPFARQWPQWIYQTMLVMVPAADRQVLRESDVRRIIISSLREAIRQGARGVLQEMALYTQPWGFSLSEIDMPVQLWHGSLDETVPILHAETLASRLPACETRFVDDEGHFSLPICRANQILDGLIAPQHETDAATRIGSRK